MNVWTALSTCYGRSTKKLPTSNQINIKLDCSDMQILSRKST